MIELRATAIWKEHRKPILSPTTLTFNAGERIGILAAAGSGKTSLARALAGIDHPNSGRILRPDGPVSILGQENILHDYMRVHSAMEMASALLGLNPNGAVKKALDFSELQNKHRARICDLSPVEKSILSFALSIQQSKGWMIADDRLVPSSHSFTARAEAAIRLRLRTSGLMFITKNATQIGRFCDRFFVLARSRLIPTSDLKVAAEIMRHSEREAVHV